MVQPLEHYQTITKNRFKDFDWQMTDYLTTFTRRAERDNLLKKKFYYKKYKITTTEAQNLIFNF